MATTVEQRRRSKGWRKPEGSVCVDRRGSSTSGCERCARRAGAHFASRVGRGASNLWGFRDPAGDPADLRGANLRGAVADEFTVWPGRFDHAARGVTVR